VGDFQETKETLKQWKLSTTFMLKWHVSKKKFGIDISARLPVA
jgi:hypothetical protein